MEQKPPVVPASALARATPLPSSLRQAINKAAHAAGLAHEQRIKAEMLARVEAAKQDGATFEQLGQMVIAECGEQCGEQN